MSETDSEFLNVGSTEGLCIWRIESFKLVKQKLSDYGSFFTGDSYLVLFTKSFNGNFNWNIHFWLGSESTLDEMGTAALKAVELDNYLGGKPVQYREVQMYESQLFKSYFEKLGGIRYLLGGASSGFIEVNKIVNQTKLYMVKGKKNVRIIQLPLDGKQLNKEDAFILDDGKNTIYQWNPPDANRIEKMKANIYAKKIRDDDHAGKSTLIVLEDDWDSNEKFWEIMKCKPSDIKQKSDVDDQDFEVNFANCKISLFKISDLNSDKPIIIHISDGPLSQNMLDNNDCFLIDARRNGIYTWIGKNCTKDEKISCLNAAKEIMAKNNYPNYYPYEQVIDGAETTSFKSIFTNWQ